ncbi:MAG: hypothetical protein Salg2KO_16820 [Salibacteraceae bacterium]
MDDPGTLIYVAFLVISLIAGWLKNRNKKKDRETLAPAPQSTSGPNSNVDIEYLREQAEMQEKADAEARERLEALTAETNQVKPEKRIRKPLFEPEPTYVDGEDPSVAEEIHNDFDARKAIIYSEILKRPHAWKI